MKKQAITLLVLTMFALPGLANAQLKKTMKADVPFDFSVNGKTFNAGQCIIETAGDSMTILTVKGGDQILMTMPNAADYGAPSATSAFVFHRYGDRYFLSGVKREGESRGWELSEGKVEKELRAKSNAVGDVTVIAAAN